MSRLELLRRQATRLVPLKHATQAALDAGDIEAGVELVVRIRRVLSKELAVAVGAVPNMFGLSRAQLLGETREEMQERLVAKVLEDPETAVAAREHDLRLTRAVAALAVTAIGTADELEAIRFSPDADSETPVDLLGLDLEDVFKAAMSFSTTTRRVGGAEKTEAFPEQPAGDPDQSSGGLLRDDADGVPESAAS